DAARPPSNTAERTAFARRRFHRGWRHRAMRTSSDRGYALWGKRLRLLGVGSSLGLPERQLFGEVLVDALERQRPADPVALHLVAAGLLEADELLLRLDPLGRDVQPRAMRHLDDCPDDARGRRID